MAMALQLAAVPVAPSRGVGLGRLPSWGGATADPTALDEVPFEQMMSSLLSAWELQVPTSAAGAAEGAAAAAAQPAAAAPAPAAAPAADASGVRLRCLDATHNSDTCQLCEPPPLEGEEGLYELVGDPGKKLRAQLARCREWRDDAARMRLAEELVGNADYARLVSCLRGADTMATLRKSDLIALTRAWSYRSAQWRRRRACSRATQRVLADLGSGGGGGSVAVAAPATRGGPASASASAAPAAAAFAILEPFETGKISGETLARYAALRLQPLAAEAVRLLAGEEARAAAVQHGWTHVTEALCAEIRAGLVHLTVLVARWRDTLTAMHALRVSLMSQPSMIAWRALAGREAALPIHEMMRQMASFMDRGVALIEQTRRAAAAPAPPAIAVWLDELHRGRMTALELIGRSQALLVNAKFAPVGQFLDACVLVHDACTWFFEQGGASMQRREKWMRALLACNADGGTSDDARAAAAAAVTLYASPFVQH